MPARECLSGLEFGWVFPFQWNFLPQSQSNKTWPHPDYRLIASKDPLGSDPEKSYSSIGYLLPHAHLLHVGLG
jgi:hypothetical protein